MNQFFLEIYMKERQRDIYQQVAANRLSRGPRNDDAGMLKQSFRAARALYARFKARIQWPSPGYPSGQRACDPVFACHHCDLAPTEPNPASCQSNHAGANQEGNHRCGG